MIPEADFVRARAQLAALRQVGNPLELQLRTAAVIAGLLKPLGGTVIVVGGSAVSFYTGGAYLSRDIDLVTSVPASQIAEVLSPTGFVRTDGAWVHSELDVVVDFPASPLAGDPARVVQIQTDEGALAVIGLEDLLIDRLNAVVHWRDTESREWCVTMLSLHRDLDMAYLERRAAEEGVAEELQSVTREAG